MPLFIPQIPPRYLGGPTLPVNISSGVLVTNQTYLQPFNLDASASVTAFSIGHGGTSAGNLDMGIYDVNGNRLTHTGVTSVATFAGTKQTITLGTPFPLAPGNYYTALWIDNGTDTYFKNGYGAGVFGSAFIEMLNAVTPAAGGLAATFAAMGGITPASDAVPLLVHIQGGF